jgi:hypothetical protein
VGWIGELCLQIAAHLAKMGGRQQANFVKKID